MSPTQPISRGRVAFAAHALGAVLFLVATLQVLFMPVDLFVHHSWYVRGVSQSLTAGLTFYLLSLGWLRLRPLGPGWGVGYAVASWLLLTLVLRAENPVASGMMRRVANPEQYGDNLRDFTRHLEYIRAVAGAIFLAVQGALVWHGLRRGNHGQP